MSQRQTLRSAAELAAAGLIPRRSVEDAAHVGRRYAIAVSPAVAALIEPGGPADPIARQFLPDARELDTHPSELADPIGDAAKSPVKGLVHRYPDRVLLKVIGVCPVYCRFCFRREMVGPEAGVTLTADEIAAALDYVRERPGITEVILTGGDPLMLSPRRAAEVTDSVAAIAHVSVLRWHTRVPVAAPHRVTHEMAAAISGSRLHGIVALHVNHIRELSQDAVRAISILREQGLTLVSQTVLLRGVNDDAETLEALMRALAAAGVRPYYLHHGDLAPGTRHFRTALSGGMAVMDLLAQRLTPFERPRYVLDIPGGFGKVPVEAPWVLPEREPGSYRVTDATGRTHTYEDALPAPRA